MPGRPGEPARLRPRFGVGCRRHGAGYDAAVPRDPKNAGPSGSPILKVRDVTVRFGGVAVWGWSTSTSFPPRSVGSSDRAGLARPRSSFVLAGVRQPTSGVVEYQGEPITHRSPQVGTRHGTRRTFQRQQTFVRSRPSPTQIPGRSHDLTCSASAQATAFRTVSERIWALKLGGRRYGLWEVRR